MTKEQYLKNLEVPTGLIDVVLDTDTYNEIDDQFALSYMLRSKEKLNCVAIYAAPFKNEKADDPEEGMLKSYDEIKKLLTLCEEERLNDVVFKGSTRYLPDEKTPIDSDAARDLCERAMKYSPEKPLYVIAIGAITNIGSALLMKPEIAENIVVVWLGGAAHHKPHTMEFNMIQDYAAARVVMGSAAPFVQLPCWGVVTEFTVSGADLEKWVIGHGKLGDYLANNTIKEAESYAVGTPWTRVIWDVCAVAWLLNDDKRFMHSDVRPVRLPGYDHKYESEPIDKEQRYVDEIYRDALMTDLFRKITE